MSKKQKKTGAGWVSRKYGKVSSSEINEFLVQLADVVRIKANQLKDAKYQTNKMHAISLRVRRLPCGNETT